MRIGFGYDVHKLVKNRKLILGGVEIPFQFGLLGHSDADVLLHAICDALLGAAGIGDIGTMFPDSDNNYKDISSFILLKKSYEFLKQKGYSINNIDSTIVAEAPKLSKYIQQMKENIATALNICPQAIGIKATTTEGLGFCGNSSGIAAYAVCSIRRDVYES